MIIIPLFIMGAIITTLVVSALIYDEVSDPKHLNHH